MTKISPMADNQLISNRKEHQTSHSKMQKNTTVQDITQTKWFWDTAVIS